MKELQAIVQALLGAGQTGAVLATLVQVEGSSYRRPGARLLLLPDGRRIGSISGGCLEEDVVARARKVAANGKPEVVVYDTTSENDVVWGVGLGCHGVVRVFLERLPARPSWAQALAANFAARRESRLVVIHGNAPDAALGTALTAVATGEGAYAQAVPAPFQLAVFGAGDDAQPLARLAAELGWRVLVADPRPAFATRERFPSAAEVTAGDAATLVARAGLDSQSAAVVMTHHYVHDLPLMRDLLAMPLAYLGLLGPRKRAERILADIIAAGAVITPGQRERLHAPVGLDLGADGAEQVALSIIAEIQSTLAGRAGGPLRERAGPIHA